MNRHAAVVTAVLAQILAMALWGVAQASPLSPLAMYTGGMGASSDGVGGEGGLVDVQTPANATVVQAFLYNVTFGGTVRSGTAKADLNGNPLLMGFVGFESLVPDFDLATFRADVTSIVKPIVDANVAGGKTSFRVSNIAGGNKGGQTDGVALVVVFSAPSIPSNQSVAILDGSQSGGAGPQTATFLLAGPLDKAAPNFNAILGLGIDFSAQGTSGHVCGANVTGQFSTVDVNGKRLSSCAGSADDGSGHNGSLITIGGVDDSIDNPPPLCQDPTCSDDELYDLSSFLSQGDRQILLTTFNPSSDDAIFVAVLQLSANIIQTCTNDCLTVPADSPTVPAPATALLLGSGLLGLAVFRGTLRGRKTLRAN